MSLLCTLSPVEAFSSCLAGAVSEPGRLWRRPFAQVAFSLVAHTQVLWLCVLSLVLLACLVARARLLVAAAVVVFACVSIYRSYSTGGGFAIAGRSVYTH